MTAFVLTTVTILYFIIMLLHICMIDVLAQSQLGLSNVTPGTLGLMRLAGFPEQSVLIELSPGITCGVKSVFFH